MCIRDRDKTWLTEGVKFKLLSLQTMADRLNLMPAPDQERGIVSTDVLARRLKILAQICEVEIAISERAPEPLPPGVKAPMVPSAEK